MKAFREIKRRARDVMRALRGEDVHELAPVRPPIIARTHRDIEHIQHTQKVEPGMYEASVLQRLTFTEKKMAEQIGRSLLKKGFIEVETTGDYLSGEPGLLVSMRLAVVRPERQKEGEA